jgi:Tfp pilus assembly protein PilF
VVRKVRFFLLVGLLFGYFSSAAVSGEQHWVEVDSPHFRVVSDGSDRDARQVALEFERMRAVLGERFPSFRLETGAPLVIFAAHDDETAKRLDPMIWKAYKVKPVGYFQHGWEKQFAVVRLDYFSPEDHEVVYHEYVHTILHANFRWLPVWLDEGLAEFYGNTQFEKDRVLIGAPSPRIGAFSERALIPISTLLEVDRASQYFRNQDKEQLFYAESWALVHYLNFAPEMVHTKKLTDFNRLLQEGMEQKKAFQQVFGDPAELEKKLGIYVRGLSLQEAVINDPPKLDAKSFTVHHLSEAETEAQIGGYRLWSGDLENARPLIEQAFKADPNLSLARESMGFLDFAEGKDEAAASEFSGAYALDGTLYLSLFYKTMLSNIARSSSPADQAKFEEALHKTLQINPQYAPAYVELAMLNVRRGNLSGALSASRRAEQLEPSRAGYHLLTGQILLRMGQEKQASEYARFVTDRWHGPDHDEAVALWNAVPPASWSPGSPPSSETPEQTQGADGWVRSSQCSIRGLELVIDHNGMLLTFRTKAGLPFSYGYSDTIFYGSDHFSPCHHLEGLHALVRYKPTTDSSYAGDIVELELREEIPGPCLLETTLTERK